jgi:hypothetical protein
VLSMTNGPDVVEVDLAAGRLDCPGWTVRSPWGFGREREVRMLSDVRSVEPRRARCASCEITHVRLPAWSMPRRRDAAEVIGRALLAKAQGDGHRKITARLERPPATVRGWLRAFAGRAEAVRGCAQWWTHGLDPALMSGPQRDRSSFASAVEAIADAARACRLVLCHQASAWELAIALTGGLLSASRATRQGRFRRSCGSSRTTSLMPSCVGWLRVKRRRRAPWSTNLVDRRLTPADDAATPSDPGATSHEDARTHVRVWSFGR